MGVNKPFLIFGLPRSMTAWLSCFLTCRHVFCQHEMMGKHSTAKEIARSIKSQPFRYSGMADPAALMLWRELTQELPDATLIYVRRNPDDSRRALARVANVNPELLRSRYDALLRAGNEFREYAEPKLVDVHDLQQEHWLRRVWSWVAPETELPEAHLAKMLSLHVRQKDELIHQAARMNPESVKVW